MHLFCITKPKYREFYSRQENPAEAPVAHPVASGLKHVYPFVAFFVSLLILLGTSEMLPLTWDEGESYDRAEKILTWCHAEQPFSQAAIEKYWIFTTQIEGHPAGYGIVIAVGQVFSQPFLSPKTSLRFGPIFLFAVAIGAVYYRVAKKNGDTAAVLSVAAILLTPRLFAHAHIAACDGSLTAAWLLAWATFDSLFDKSTKRKAFAVIVWGCCLGLVMSMKFTGWIAPVAFGMIVVSRIRSFGWKWIPLAVLVPFFVFYLLNPPLWFSPIHGLVKFFMLNTNRSDFNISIQFLGRMYNLDHPLPWYNTIVWTLITVPLGFLLVVLFGICTFLQKRHRNPDKLWFCASILVSPLLLFVVRSIPGTPPHDGVRLFVTAYAFVAIFIGISAALICKLKYCGIGIGLVSVAIIYGFGMFNTYWYSPQWLSYYNAVIGGLAGAQRAGMEPTYYWDSLDREVCIWLEKNTGPNEIVVFTASSPKSLTLQKKWGRLRTEYYRKNDPVLKNRKIKYYVLQRRPSGEYARDKTLIKQAKPVYTKYVKRGGFWIWRLDNTPILEVYDINDLLKVNEKAAQLSKKLSPND